MPKKNKNNKDLRFKFVFPENYNPVFANGVWGGFTAKGELNMNFFHERLPIPYSVVHKIQEDGKLGEEVSRDPSEQMVIRCITAGVVLNYSDAKTVHRWIGEKLERFEKEFGIEELAKTKE